MTPNPCPHSRLIYLGIQEIPNNKPLRLYNCAACHTTIARHQYFRTGEEIADLILEIEQMRSYLLDEYHQEWEEQNFTVLEALINEVSRARTPEFWR